jgi:hypothetical protein
MADAWFELYENANFNNYGDDPGQVYHVDYREKDAKNGKNMGTNYFNDKASSIRYCIPVGSSVYFYRDAWSGSYQYLNGDGGIRFLPNLTAINYSYGGGSMNDSITSYAFYPGHTDPYGNIAIYDPGN